MTKEEMVQMKNQIDEAIKVMNQDIDGVQWNQMCSLFKRAINLRITGVNYANFATRLIFHATKLGINDEYLSNLASNLLVAESQLNGSKLDNMDDYNKIFVFQQIGLPQTEISMENPYIGYDGKDYQSYNALQSSNELYKKNKK